VLVVAVDDGTGHVTAATDRQNGTATETSPTLDVIVLQRRRRGGRAGGGGGGGGGAGRRRYGVVTTGHQQRGRRTRRPGRGRSRDRRDVVAGSRRRRACAAETVDVSFAGARVSRSSAQGTKVCPENYTK